MEKFIIQPSIKVFVGLTVKRDSVIDFKKRCCRAKFKGFSTYYQD